MATYLIGDLQGCFAELQLLLQKIQFDPEKDRLGFVGDLVNRGTQSLECLRFIKNLPNPLVVLGNHDFYLLALGYGAKESHAEHHTLNDILQAPDRTELLEWLRAQPLFYYDPTFQYTLVHAGIPPQWNLEQAQQYADEVRTALISSSIQTTLGSLFGNSPACWREDLKDAERLRYIVNAFTRMRFCDAKGCLELKEKQALKHPLPKYQPWFRWSSRIDCDIFFGHWAALEGMTHHPKRYALDTGCAWGRSLTALRVEDRKRFSVSAIPRNK